MSLIIGIEELPILLASSEKAPLYYAQIEALKENRFDDPALDGFSNEPNGYDETDRALESKINKLKEQNPNNPDINIINIIRRLYMLKFGVNHNYYADPQSLKDNLDYWNIIQPIFGLEYDINRNSQTFKNDAKEKIRAFLIIANRYPIHIRSVLLKKVAYLFENEPELYTKIWTEIAQNPLDLQGKTKAFYVTKNINIARDVIESYKQSLTKELAKEYPDIAKVQEICKIVKSICNEIKNLTPENAEYAQTVSDEFDFEKMMTIGEQYFQQIQKSLEERLAEAEARVKSAEKRANEAEQRAKNEEARASRSETDRNNEKQQHQQELQAAQNKSAMLTQEMDKMQQQLDAQNLFIKNLQIKIATLKTGLFGRGMTPEELQKWIAENVPQESR